MIVIFQILFVIFAIVAAVGVAKKRAQGLLSTRGLVFWILFWVAASIAVVFPDTTSFLAKHVGIGRGTDLIVYVAISGIFYVLFHLHIKLERLNRDITKVVRRDALDGHKNIKA